MTGRQPPCRPGHDRQPEREDPQRDPGQDEDRNESESRQPEDHQRDGIHDLSLVLELVQGARLVCFGAGSPDDPVGHATDGPSPAPRDHFYLESPKAHSVTISLPSTAFSPPKTPF